MKARTLGTCVSYNGSYAWLRPTDGGKDCFVHESEWPDGTISVGDKCTFDLVPDKYKPGRFRATNVQLVGEEKQTDDVGPGMYAQPEPDSSALAEGLRKLMRDPQRDGETNP
jgi:cold shock CspA family protein